MKCTKCLKPVEVVGVMHRTNPKGTTPAGWTCEPCLKKHDPELLRNIKEEIQSI